MPRAGKTLATDRPGCHEKPVLTLKEQKCLEKLPAQDQREIKALKKELQRREKAMAEMAALLVLRKKWEPFCSEDAKGSPAPLTGVRRSS